MVLQILGVNKTFNSDATCECSGPNVYGRDGFNGYFWREAQIRTDPPARGKAGHWRHQTQ